MGYIQAGGYYLSEDQKPALLVGCLRKGPSGLNSNGKFIYNARGHPFVMPRAKQHELLNIGAATLRVDINGKPDSIPFRTLVEAVRNTLAILEELDAALSHRADGSLEWYVKDLGKNGTLRYEVYSRMKPLKRPVLQDVAPRVTDEFVAGFNSVEREAISPPFLTQAGIKHVQRLASIVGINGAKSLTATSTHSHQTAQLSRKACDNLVKLIPSATTSVGSVEGTLEVIALRPSPRFVVYHGVSNKAVTCKIPSEKIEQAKNALGKRVHVFGVINRNVKGEPIRIALEEMREFPSNDKIPAFSELAGNDPDFTGDLSTEEFIRSIRE